jgi:hypothetical protein
VSGHIVEHLGVLYCPTYLADGGRTSAFIIKSTDDGATWTNHVRVANGSTSGGDNLLYSEMCFGVLDDGTWMALVRDDGNNLTYRFTITEAGFVAGSAWTRQNSFAMYDAPRWIQIPKIVGAATAQRIYTHGRSAYTSPSIWYSDDRGANWTGYGLGSSATSIHGGWDWDAVNTQLILMAGTFGNWAYTIDDFITSPVIVDPNGNGDFYDEPTALTQISAENGAFDINRLSAGDYIPTASSVTLGANLTTVTIQNNSTSIQHAGKWLGTTGLAYGSKDLTIILGSANTVLHYAGMLHEGLLTIQGVGTFELVDHLDYGSKIGVTVGQSTTGNITVQNWNHVALIGADDDVYITGIQLVGAQVQGTINHVSISSASASTYYAFRYVQVAGTVVFTNCAGFVPIGGFAFSGTGDITGSDYNASNDTGSGVGTHNLINQDVNLTFIDPASDLHLKAGSLLILAGTPVGTDIGAYPYTGVIASGTIGSSGKDDDDNQSEGNSNEYKYYGLPFNPHDKIRDRNKGSLLKGKRKVGKYGTMRQF